MLRGPWRESCSMVTSRSPTPTPICTGSWSLRRRRLDLLAMTCQSSWKAIDAADVRSPEAGAGSSTCTARSRGTRGGRSSSSSSASGCWPSTTCDRRSCSPASRAWPMSRSNCARPRCRHTWSWICRRGSWRRWRPTASPWRRECRLSWTNSSACCLSTTATLWATRRWLRPSCRALRGTASRVGSACSGARRSWRTLARRTASGPSGCRTCRSRRPRSTTGSPWSRTASSSASFCRPRKLVRGRMHRPTARRRSSGSWSAPSLRKAVLRAVRAGSHAPRRAARLAGASLL
mmetsp:Transcript_67017/g.150122  ORF Transcript_67017/g.150122 Transcript_67017/m.150122 type:complete len:291 (-) Transcript_67017:163-1035(-)